MSDFQFECIELNLQTPTDYFGRFLFKPLDRADAVTIGNALRRVLLGNLPAMRIVGVRIAGVNHEFTTIPGIREDVMEILLNLQELIFKSSLEEASLGRLKVQGPAVVTASCINLPSTIEIINPNHYIATISDNSILEMEMKLDWGKGFLLAEDQFEESPLDFLRLDAVFMPVKEVSYKIEKVGNEEQLVLDLWTNGSITPSEAVSLASKTILHWFQNLTTVEGKISKPENSIKQRDLTSIPIEELNLSARAYNALKRAQINFIGELVNYSLKDLRDIKNFGQKSVQEVLEALESHFGVLME